MLKINYIAESLEGDSIAFYVLAEDRLSTGEIWTRAIQRAEEFLPADTCLGKLEIEDMEEVRS